ncbi:MAG: dihydroorotase [Patescibacteria group bacterium]
MRADLKGRLIIQNGSDMHVHLRDEAILAAVASLTARQFGQALVMPNLTPPIVTAEHAIAYRERIRAVLPPALASFIPRMTIYLTDDTSPDDVRRAFRKDNVTGERAAEAVKLYPAHATTNSAHGVTDIKKTYRTLATMEEIGMPLCLHGETPFHSLQRVPQMDRERVFIEITLLPLLQKFPKLKVVLEHVSTKEGANLVLCDKSGRLGASVTPQHLLYSFTDMCEGGFRPHLICMPILKDEVHRDAIREAVSSGSKYFWAGTDSAPHVAGKKHSHCCPFGVFSASLAVEAYLEAFDQMEALGDNCLENFLSFNGPAFFGLPPSPGEIILERKAWAVEEPIRVTGAGDIWPFLYEPDPEKRQKLSWQIVVE